MTRNAPLSNSIPEIQGRVAAGSISWNWPLVMLIIRFILFAGWQLLIALLLAAQGRTDAWSAAAAWWPATATLTNLVCLTLLLWLFRREGVRLVDVFGFDRAHIGRDLVAVLGILVVSAPLAYLPNVAIATWLFGDVTRAVDLMFRPLPLWAAYLSLALFPVTIALTELPTYYAYAMPRLEALAGRSAVALTLAVFWHAAQHVTLPLVFDWRFIVWRFVMFLPFALWIALCLRWRPRLLPYLIIAHALIDLQAVWLVYAVSQ